MFRLDVDVFRPSSGAGQSHGPIHSSRPIVLFITSTKGRDRSALMTQPEHFRCIAVSFVSS
jgi:hypothetical protein